MKRRLSAPPAPPTTRVDVIYPRARGRIGLRGEEPALSWEETRAPTRIEGDRHVFELPIPESAILELKVVRDDGEWAGGRNYAVHAGDDLVIEPFFDRTGPELVTGQSVGDLAYDVLLPASYEEQENKRYPVLYMLDGQALWTTSEDPFGVWGLDAIVAQLEEIGAIEELVIIGIHTADRRAEILSPVPDAEYGGGEGPQLLDAIVGPLRAHVNATYRTRTERDDTGIMGSSMGGLFAFYAAMQRSDVFGKAGCLSSSFWWADRWAVRWVQGGHVPAERPHLYLDTGAARSALEEDANVRDGFHHTRAMFRALTEQGYETGLDLDRLVFAGATHDAASWAARVGIPLQLLFPSDPRRPRH